MNDERASAETEEETLQHRSTPILLLGVGSGGFRHVQHVRPNRGPHKRSGKFLYAGKMGNPRVKRES